MISRNSELLEELFAERRFCYLSCKWRFLAMRQATAAGPGLTVKVSDDYVGDGLKMLSGAPTNRPNAKMLKHFRMYMPQVTRHPKKRNGAPQRGAQRTTGREY